MLTFEDGTRLYATFSTVTGALGGPAVTIDSEVLSRLSAREDEFGFRSELDAYVDGLQDARDDLNVQSAGDISAAAEMACVEVCVVSTHDRNDYEPWWAAADRATGIVVYGFYADAFGDGCASVEQLIGHGTHPRVHTLPHALRWADGNAAKAAAKLASEGVPATWTPAPEPRPPTDLGHQSLLAKMASWFNRRLRKA